MDFSLLSDPNKPSFFELQAQDKMRDLLFPALRYLINHATERYPRYLLRLANSLDELYALFMLGIEWHFLTHCKGSFSENFYGLKRVSHPQSPLTKRQWYGSLIFLVGWPYLQSKLDHWHAQWKERMNRPGLSPLKIMFVHWFPYFKSVQWAVLFGYQLAYLMNRSPYFTPWLHLLGISIQRLLPEDIREFQDLKRRKSLEEWESVYAMSPTQQFRHSFMLFFWKFMDLFQQHLPNTIFFVKFLDWWHTSEHAKLKQQKPIPPPPHPLPIQPNGISLSSDPNHCSLCQNPRQNPTAIPSGHVFCYRCIYSHVQKHESCPLTFMSVQVQDLRRLYING